MTRPRHRRDHHPVFATVHARRLGLQGGRDRAQIQGSPPPPAFPGVIPTAPLTAPPAPAPPPPFPGVIPTAPLTAPTAPVPLPLVRLQAGDDRFLFLVDRHPVDDRLLD